MLEAGLVEAVSTGRLKPTQASVPFRALMAQLAKFPLFDQPWTHCETDEEKGPGSVAPLQAGHDASDSAH